ncbi:MAG TPA: glycoside hydrolase family 3 N-terminal domain-containing protein [Candidatus Binataceae bacterium]|nr:glycoside hydrolase family 3 N-terminal domain-containing protein [Candidatus Binataceae bacterium]
MERYKDRALPIDARVEDLLAKMNLDEKIAQLGGIFIQLMVKDNQIDGDRARELLKNGIAHVSRPAGLMKPAESVRAMNAVQRVLVEQTRLGIPAIFHEESCAGYQAQDATCFPMPLGLAGTFDPALVEKMGAIIRRQMTAVGARHTLAPVADIIRDARWGRCEETFGEDVYLVSRMTVAYVRGVQGGDISKGVICTGKHYAGYSFSEGGLNWAPAHIATRELLDTFIPPFAAMISEANLRSIMNAYQEIDGIPCGASSYLLNDLLRGEMRFTGTVVSDYFTLPALHGYHNIAANPREAARLGLEAGLDVELPQLDVYGAALKEAVAAQEVSLELIDRAVSRVLRAKFELGLFENPFASEGAVAAAFNVSGDRELAREMAEKSIVMLKNENRTLPLDSKLKRIAVIGPTADSKRLLQGDYHFPTHQEMLFGPIPERPLKAAAKDSRQKLDLSDRFPKMVTPFEGIRAAIGSAAEVRTAYGCNAFDDDRSAFAEAVETARWAELVVLCVGGKSGLIRGCSSGEATDRATLCLPGVQEELVAAISATGKPIVLVVIDGRPLALTKAIEKAAAALYAFLPGEEGGTAIADVLTGRVNPGGRLAVSLPRDQGQMPLYYAHKPSGQRSQFWGDYADLACKPLFPFGYGLGYSSFTYSDGKLSAAEIAADGNLRVSIEVKNEGPRDGDEIVQLYLRDIAGSVTRPVKELKGFARVAIHAGEKRRVTFTLDMSQAAFHGRDLSLAVEPGEMEIQIGASSEDIRFKAGFRIIGKRRQLGLLDVKPTAVEIG